MPLLRNRRAEQRFRAVDEQHEILVLPRNPAMHVLEAISNGSCP